MSSVARTVGALDIQNFGAKGRGGGAMRASTTRGDAFGQRCAVAVSYQPGAGTKPQAG